MNSKSITLFTDDYLCPPISDTSIVCKLVHDEYGLTATRITTLNSYEDRNYHIEVKEEHENPYLKDTKISEIMVKIVNPEDSKIFAYVDAQRELMSHLNNHGIKAPSEIQNLKGSFFSQIDLPQNGSTCECYVSVRTYLTGDIVASHTLTPKLLYQLGAYLADFDQCCVTFKNEFYESFDCLWSLNNTLKVREVVHVIQNAEHQKIVNEILDTFEREVQPQLKDCRKGLIHGDPNEQNILSVPDPHTNSGLAIAGILDFQEASKSYHIFDLSAMSAYMMMHTKTEVKPIDAAAYVLAGYTYNEQLRPSERACFRALIGARMAMSLTYGAYVHSKLMPDNTYVLTTGQIGWAVLTQFWLTPKDEVEKRWDEIIASRVLPS